MTALDSNHFFGASPTGYKCLIKNKEALTLRNGLNEGYSWINSKNVRVINSKKERAVFKQPLKSLS